MNRQMMRRLIERVSRVPGAVKPLPHVVIDDVTGDGVDVAVTFGEFKERRCFADMEAAEEWLASIEPAWRDGLVMKVV